MSRGKFAGEVGFWSQVDKVPGGCWLWQGTAHRGYGVAHLKNKGWRAHRLAYYLIWGFIPEGKHLDHLCGNTLCVYPWHLEPVTPRENQRRKTLRLRHLKTSSAMPSPAGCRNSSKQQHRAAWYAAWLRSFRPVFTNRPLAHSP